MIVLPEFLNWTLLVSGAIGGAAVLTGFALWNKPKKAISSTTRKTRSMSFSSSFMIGGAFPPAAQVRPAIINVLFLFNVCPSVQSLMEACKNLLHYDRFRSSARFDGEKWTFVEADVKLGDQIRTVGVISERAVMEEVDRIMQNDLEGYDGYRPLWIFHRITNRGTGSSGLLLRIHHSIGDGISLVSIMSRLFTDEKGVPVAVEIPAKTLSEKPTAPPKFSLFDTVKSFIQVVTLPISAFDTPIKFINAPEPRGPLVMTKKRRTIVFPTVRLDFVKNLKNKAAVTVNDILLTAVTGAIKRYCENKKDKHVLAGDADTKLRNRCLMPVAFPRSKNELEDPAKALRNYWAFLSAPMPIGPHTSKERLEKCTEITTALKRSPQAAIQMWIQNNITANLPTFLARQTAHDAFSRHTMVFSNVPGPADVVKFCGESVVGFQVMFPNIIPQALMLSYGGGIFCNLCLDDEPLEDAAVDLPQLYLEELRELAKEYGVDAQDSEVLLEESVGKYFRVLKA